MWRIYGRPNGRINRLSAAATNWPLPLKCCWNDCPFWVHRDGTWWICELIEPTLHAATQLTYSKIDCGIVLCRFINCVHLELTFRFIWCRSITCSLAVIVAWTKPVRHCRSKCSRRPTFLFVRQRQTTYYWMPGFQSYILMRISNVGIGLPPLCLNDNFNVEGVLN